MSDHFFVVTGGPGSGKTSLITELARRGFHSVPESGRAIIREEVPSGGDALPWEDRMAYAERMLERDLRAYEDAQALSGPVIFDRGIPDIMGYLSLCGLSVPPHVAAAAKAARYNRRAFLAPFWDEIFTQDSERKLDLSRFDAAPLIAFTATKETGHGTETVGGIPSRCGAYRINQRADA